MWGKYRGQKIKKSYLILFLLLMGVGVLLKLFEYHFSDAEVLLKDQKLHVLVAKSPKQWYRGLGKRESLGAYNGMIFVYPFEDSHGIVMRDMHFSIDVVWFLNGKVVDIAPNVPVYPQDRPYWPRTVNNTILELPAGWVDAHGLKIGDSLTVVSTSLEK